MSRIDYLKTQIVECQRLEKAMPSGSPPRLFLEKQRSEFERELDRWLKFTKEEPEEPQEPSCLVQALLSQLCAAALVPVTSEHFFHPSRKWRFDLAWVEKKIAVEVHGGTWSNGRHTRGQGFENDREKMNEAALLGWIVLEVTGEQIQSGQALSWVERALEGRGWVP